MRQPYVIKQLGASKNAPFAILASFALLAFAWDAPGNLPFTPANITKAIKLKADDYLVNSILIALMTALGGATIAFFTACLSARMKSRNARLLQLASITIRARAMGNGVSAYAIKSILHKGLNELGLDKIH